MEKLKSKIIGDKEVMAIEYRITQKKPYIMGNLILWMGGVYIGTFEEEQMLLNIAYGLERLATNISSNERLNHLGKDEIYHLLNKNNQGHLVNLGEGFDDFLVYSYVTDNELNFIWNLLDEPFFTYPSYPSGLGFAKIPKEFLIDVVEEFKTNLLTEETTKYSEDKKGR